MTSLSSTQLGLKAIQQLNNAEKVLYGANKLILCALLQANSDTQLQDNILIASYFELDSKKQKMNWRENVLGNIFGLTKDIAEKRHINAIMRVLPVVTLLIKEGYKLIQLNGTLTNDVISSHDDQRKVIYNSQKNELYLPAFACVETSDNTAPFNMYKLIKCETSFETMERLAKKQLNIATGGNTQRNNSNSEGETNVNNATITISNNNNDSETLIATAPSYAILFEATVKAIESKDFIEFDNDARLSIYKLYQHLHFMLNDDVRNDLINQDIDIEELTTFQSINAKQIAA